MTASEVASRPAPGTRPAFDLFEGFAASSILAGLEMAGLLAELESDGLGAETVQSLGAEASALLTASLRYLGERGLVEERAGVHRLTDRGRAVCADKGYLVWLVGGYGGPLRRMDGMLVRGERYGLDHVRDGRWVAGGAALLSRDDVLPHALEVLERIDFTQVLDLGCGNARFLARVCQTFGCRGVGVDLSPEACADAEAVVRDAGLADRVQVLCADAGSLEGIPVLGGTDLVVTFFLLHEILAHGRDRLVRYLSDLSAQLPAGAHLLIAEVEPPAPGGGGEVFTPEFTLVHAIMGQTLMNADGWRDALEEGGFTLLDVVRTRMPGGLILLCGNGA